MKCAACGEPLPARARFCPACGARVAEEEPAWATALQRFVRGDYAGAQEEVKPLLERGVPPVKRAKALAWNGHALFFQGREDAAVAAYREALALDPTLWGAAYQMGSLAFAAGRLAEALESFTLASGLRPELEQSPLAAIFEGRADNARARVHLYRALCLRDLGRRAEAEDDLVRAISLDGANPLPYGVLGDLLMGAGRHIEAAERISEGLKWVRDEQGLRSLRNDLGVAYFQAGELERAAEAFKAVLKEHPEDANALHNLGMLYLKRGLGEELRKDLREFLKSDRADQILLGLTRSLVEGARGAAVPADTGIIGQSRAVQDNLQLIARAARVDANVLVLGENGTGKELVARAIHSLGPRAKGPFVAVNCAALPETLLESELFGYEKGAFTGAAAAKPGRFEIATGGTLFLDEIGDLQASLQAKLLRVVQEKAFERLGGTRTLRPDFRLIAATHQDLRRAVVEGRFREDLFYRLFVLPIQLAPLRDRPEDIALLAEHFLRKFSRAGGRHYRRLTPQALDKLRHYPWPGNVRELEHCIERAMAMHDAEVLDAPDLQFDALASAPGNGGPAPLESSGTETGRPAVPGGLPMERGRAQGSGWTPLETAEREALAEALRSKRPRNEVASRLGMSRATLYRKIAKYGLESLDNETMSLK